MTEVYKKFIYDFLAEITDEEILKKIYTVICVFIGR